MGERKIEIERKFLIRGSLRDIIGEKTRRDQWVPPCEFIRQGYLPDTGQWAIRGRSATNGEKANQTGDWRPHQYYITMKRKLSERSSVEIETTTSRETYEEIIASCGHSPIEKNRWYFDLPKVEGAEPLVITVDEFLNPQLDGLVLAEIELPSEDTEFPRPDWLGEEVTHMSQYRNFAMVSRLWINWL